MKENDKKRREEATVRCGSVSLKVQRMVNDHGLKEHTRKKVICKY